MLIDKLAKFSGDQAITATAACTDTMDLLAAGDSIGRETYFIFIVKTAFTAGGNATLTIDLETDDNNSFSSAIALYSSGAIAVADLVAGYKIAIRVPKGLERYLRANYTVTTGPMTAGAADAFLADSFDHLVTD